MGQPAYQGNPSFLLNPLPLKKQALALEGVFVLLLGFYFGNYVSVCYADHNASYIEKH